MVEHFHKWSLNKSNPHLNHMSKLKLLLIIFIAMAARLTQGVARRLASAFVRLRRDKLPYYCDKEISQVSKFLCHSTILISDAGGNSGCPARGGAARLTPNDGQADGLLPRPWRFPTTCLLAV